jgi:hypothetical protein
MPNENPKILPDFKAQCDSRSIEAQDPPARGTDPPARGTDPPARGTVASALHTALSSARHQRASDNEGHVQSENAEEPQAVEHLADAIQIPGSFVPIAEVVRFPVSDEESQRQVPHPPDPAADRQQEQEIAVATVVRRYTAYLPLLVAVLVVAVVVVGSICGTGKCSGGGETSSAAVRESPGLTAGQPNPTEAPPPLDPTMAPITSMSQIPALSTTIPTVAELTPEPIAFLSQPPTLAPTEAPTATSTRQPAPKPSSTPMTLVPTEAPNATPSGHPNPKPTTVPTTLAPIEAPTATPTREPTPKPIGVRASAIAALINNITLTGKTIAYPPVNGTGSVTAAEEHALQWLIEKDPLSLTASNKFRLQQRYALLTLWFKTTRNGLGWYTNTGWLTAEDECTWYNVTCADVDVGAGQLQSVVESIFLQENNLRGDIPADLGLLTKLKIANFYRNSLAGSLPKSIGRWRNLEEFVVYDNLMTGTLPAASIGQWTALTFFQIGGNSFIGTLPDSIGNWSKLGYFSVYKNFFEGTIPESVQEWTSIETAYFTGNDFTGSMSTGICDIKSLKTLEADCLSEVTCTCCTACY